MNTVLWFQSSKATGEDYLYIDGQPCETEQRQKEMRFLLDNRNSSYNFLMKRKGHQWNPLISDFKGIVERCLKNGTDISNNLMCYIDSDKKYMIDALFNERDEVGRKTAYIYYANTTDIETAIQWLKEIANSVGKTCNEKDFIALRKIQQKSNEKKKIYITSLITIIILVLCAIIAILF